MSNLIPISLAEAALDAQAADLQKLRLTELKAYVSKASFDEVWVLYQQALEEIQMLKQANRGDLSAQLKVTQSAALSLANLADNAFYYSREHRAAADILIKTIRTICPDHNG
jgi:hypothetical protein